MSTKNGQYALFLGDLSISCTEQNLADEFSAFGEIIDVRIKRSKETGKALSYGFVEFLSLDAATTAMKTMNGVIFQGRPIRIRWATNRSHSNAQYNPQEEDQQRNRKGPSIHVRFTVKDGRSFVSEESLRALFTQFGIVFDCTIKQQTFDQSQRSRGYGFVSFHDSAEGLSAAYQAAHALRNASVDGVNYLCEISNKMYPPATTSSNTAAASSTTYAPLPSQFSPVHSIHGGSKYVASTAGRGGAVDARDIGSRVIRSVPSVAPYSGSYEAHSRGSYQASGAAALQGNGIHAQHELPHLSMSAMPTFSSHSLPLQYQQPAPRAPAGGLVHSHTMNLSHQYIPVREKSCSTSAAAGAVATTGRRAKATGGQNGIHFQPSHDQQHHDEHPGTIMPAHYHLRSPSGATVYPSHIANSRGIDTVQHQDQHLHQQHALSLPPQSGYASDLPLARPYDRLHEGLYGQGQRGQRRFTKEMYLQQKQQQQQQQQQQQYQQQLHHQQQQQEQQYHYSREQQPQFHHQQQKHSEPFYSATIDTAHPYQQQEVFTQSDFIRGGSFVESANRRLMHRERLIEVERSGRYIAGDNVVQGLSEPHFQLSDFPSHEQSANEQGTHFIPAADSASEMRRAYLYNGDCAVRHSSHGTSLYAQYTSSKPARAVRAYSEGDTATTAAAGLVATAGSDVLHNSTSTGADTDASASGSISIFGVDSPAFVSIDMEESFTKSSIKMSSAHQRRRDVNKPFFAESESNRLLRLCSYETEHSEGTESLAALDIEKQNLLSPSLLPPPVHGPNENHR